MRGSMTAERCELRMEAVDAVALAPLLSANPADRIIVALDGMAPEQALAFAAKVEGLRWVKVGLELFVQAGPEVVAQLREQGVAGVPRSQISRHPGHDGRCLPAGGGAGYRTDHGACLRRQRSSAGSSGRGDRRAPNVLANPLQHCWR